MVQRGAGPFLETLQRHLGDDAVEFLTRTFPDDGPVIRGEAEVVPLLATALLERGSEADAEELFTEVWLAIEVLPDDGARAAVLLAERWESADGMPALRALLERHDLRLSG